MARVERRALVPAAAVFAAILATGALVVTQLRRYEADDRRRAALELAQGSAHAIEQQFAQALAGATTLAAMVREGASGAQLDGVANRLLDLAGGTLSIQLARDGVISHIWPMAGNEAALGLDLVRHPVHGPFTAKVIASRGALLYGPFDLVQGGRGFALRIPVHVRDGAKERVWGVASAILRLPVLLEETRIARLDAAGFDYAIVRQLPSGAPGELIATSGPRGLQGEVSVGVELPGQRWVLALAPQAARAAVTTPVALPVALGMVALLAGLLVYRAAALPALLRREVAARTRELEQAHEEQRRAEEHQRQSQRLEAIGLLAGGVAHDFNNVLSGILGHADLLAAEAEPGSATAEAAQTISQAAQRAAALTRQLLAVARLGRQRVVRVDVHAAVTEVVGLLGRTLDKSIRVETRLTAPEHAVRGDPVQLQQVVLNLAVNARDAMPDGGTLAIETSVEAFEAGAAPPGLAPGRYLVLSVTDTGSGVPPEIRERVFEPFFTTKPEGKGSGLGLATVFGIAKGHGGAVRVDDAPGGGARFVVHLPLLEGEAEAEAGPAGAAPHGKGVILVVDDEEMVRKTATRILASLSYSPVAVAGGQEAIDWMAAQPAPPAAVLLDLAMPGMDGRTTFRRLRAAHPGLRVVISSGFSRSERGEELLAEGAHSFLQKPYRMDDLARAIADAIGPPGG